MDTKARVGLFVGGLVLVGMVAWILMPGSKPADKDQVAVNTDTAQNNAEPASQPATAPAGDIFAGGPAATQPVAPSTLSFGQTLPPATQPTMNTAMNAAGAAGAATDVWGRTLDGSNATTAVFPGATGAAESTGVFPRTYKVGAGESFYTISEKVYGNGKYAARIAAANPNVDARRMKVGQEITLPDVTGNAVASPVVSTHASGGSVSVAKTYKVQAGDTLRKISTKMYGTADNWEKIYAANKTAIGSDPSKLKAGSTLQIP